jgi:hypothetical protein
MRNQCNDSNEERGHAVQTRREVLKAGAALMAAPFLGGVTTTVQATRVANAGGLSGVPRILRRARSRIPRRNG